MTGNDIPILGIDTETYPFRPGMMAPPIVCLSWAMGDRKGIMLRHEVAQFMGGALEEAAAGRLLIYGQSVSYDMACMMAGIPELSDAIWRAYAAGGIRCTYITEKLLDIAEGTRRGRYDPEEGTWIESDYSLQGIALRRCGIEVAKEDSVRLGFDRLDGVPLEQWPEESIAYALEDASVLLPVIRAQREAAPRVKADLRDEAAQARADIALRLASVWGVRTDPDAVKELDRKTTDAMMELLEQMRRAGLVTSGGKKIMEAIRDRIKACWKDGDPPSTKGGKISTSAQTIEDCHDDLLDAVSEFTSLQKSGSTYIDALKAGTEKPIHAGFDVLGAASGRTSSFSPNIQNQPRMPGVRECFVPRPGNVFASADYDSQELRTLGQSCMDIVRRSRLAEAYRKDPGFDPHTAFAGKMIGIGYEEAMARKAAHDREIKELRQRAKAANFGFPGGLGARTFVGYARGYGLTITEDEAHGLRSGWFASWPEMDAYFAHVSSVVGQADAGRMVQLRTGRVRGLVGYTDCANGYFQGLAADCSKRALFEVSRRCYSVPSSALYGARPWNFVHDSIELEVAEDRAADAAEEMAQAMIEEMQKLTPDVPARATAALMRRWAKDAEPVRDAGGKLVPWEPKERK